jgi:nucleoside-diphosphate-sugar epimerase
MRKLLVIGSSGLIGSEVVDYFCNSRWQVHSVDNNMRADFFGSTGDTRWNEHRLKAAHENFFHHESDIQDRCSMDALLEALRPVLIVHAPAQPSHDYPWLNLRINRLANLFIRMLFRISLNDTTDRLSTEYQYQYLP